MLLMFQKTIALHHSSEVGESCPARAGQEPAESGQDDSAGQGRGKI